jgi:acyl carrier protein
VSTDREAVLNQLTDFFTGTLLTTDQIGELTPHTSLRELGVLNSLGLARLLAFIRDDLGVDVPVRELSGSHFTNLNEITDLILSARQRVQ